jgi:hypothetical protein
MECSTRIDMVLIMTYCLARNSKTGAEHAEAVYLPRAYLDVALGVLDGTESLNITQFHHLGRA